MKQVIAILLVVLTVLSVQSYPYPPKQVHPNPQQHQYPYFIQPIPQQQQPQDYRMQGMYSPFYAYFQQFMALFRQFLISQQNPTVPSPEPDFTTTTAAPVGTCDLRENVCVPVNQCEHASEIQSFTCTNPQHVCCDN